MRLRYRIPLAVISIMMVGTMFLASSYAYWKATAYQEVANVIESGCFSVEYTEQTESVSLKNSYPLTDIEGLKTKPYSFTIKNTCTVNAEYTVYLNTLQVDGTKIDDSLISYALENSIDQKNEAKKLNTATINTDTSSFSYDKPLLTSYALDTKVIAPGGKVSYDLRLWIDEDATTAINNYKFEAGITSVAYASIKDGISGTLCKRATSLHNDMARLDSYNGWNSVAVAADYGSLGTPGILLAGDAFDCDVNGDGEYNSLTERFYYVSDFYDTKTKSFDRDYATLIYSNNTVLGVIDNKGRSVYTSYGLNTPGPSSAKEYLPTTSQWRNVSLKHTRRNILNENGDVIFSDFNYEGYAARLLTVHEINEAFGSTGIYHGGLFNTSSNIFMLHNTKYSNLEYNDVYWLETGSSNNSNAYGVSSYGRDVGTYHVNSSSDTYADTGIGVRPVIDVSKTEMAY